MRTYKFFLRLFTLLFALWGAEDAPEGYHARTDVGARQTVDGTPIPTLWDDFNQRLAVFNRMHTIVEARLAQPTSLVFEKVAVPRRAKMEQASEFGQPKLIRTEFISRGYPLVHYDIGVGFTIEFLDEATAQQINAVADLAEEAWNRRRRQTIYEALFGNLNFTDKDGHAVKRLYNADGEVPPEYESYVHTGSHTHYLFTAGVAVAEADLNTMESHLLHHGYGDDSIGGTGGQLWLHVPRDVMATIRTFTGFIPAQTASVAVILDGQIVGGQQPTGPGVQGYFGRWTIVEDPTIPAGYLLGFVSGGEFNVNNPVRVRQHVNPSARGLRLNPGRNDYPLLDSFYDGYVGAGIAHRGGAVVMFEDTGAGGAYVAPTF